MTLSSLVTRTDYSGDGATTAFATGFGFWNSSDLRVLLVSSSGSETVLTQGTNYTVSGGGSGATGTINVSTSDPPASGERLVVKSNVALLQGTDLPTGGSFNSDDVEEELDRTVRRLQQFDETLDRTVQLAEASTYTSVTIPDPSSGEILMWSTDGTFENAVANSSQYLSIPIPIADGGTGATTASSARFSLGVSSSAWQPLDGDLTAIAALTHSSSTYSFMVSDGSSWTISTSSSARAVLGIGSTGTLLTNYSSATPVGADYAFIRDASNSDFNSQARLDRIAALSLGNTGFASSQYYTGPFSPDITSLTNSTVLSADTIYVVPLDIGANDTITRIGIDILTASTGAGTARLGLYAGSLGVPSTLTFDAGTVSTASTGEKEITISEALEPGFYWGAVAANLAFTINASVPDRSEQQFRHGLSGRTASGQNTRLSSASTSAPSGLPATWTNTTYTNGFAPVMWVRKV